MQRYRENRHYLKKKQQIRERGRGVIWDVGLKGGEGKIRGIFILLSSPLSRETLLYVEVFATW